jgi:predicted lipoprotein with Yx(FWY)xxD motif
MRRTLPILALAFILAGCGSSSPAVQTTAPVIREVTITTSTISGLGTVLVNGTGRTLYVYAPDAAKRVTCNGGCQQDWPPLQITAAQHAKAQGGVAQNLIGSDPNPLGGLTVTYNGWPLYTFIGDSNPGNANGQDEDLQGGYWYVITPSGALIKKPA